MTTISALAVLIAAFAMAFGGAYIALSIAIPSQKKARAFAVPFFVALGNPLAKAIAPLVAWPRLVELLGYGCLLSALLILPAALSRFYRLKPDRLIPLVIFVIGMGLQVAVALAHGNALQSDVAAQLPLLVAAIFGFGVVRTLPALLPFRLALAGLFGMLATHFALQVPIMFWAGSAGGMPGYTPERYAVTTELLAGVAVVTVGLTLLMAVIERAMTYTTALAEVDPLSGVYNRRGFESRAAAMAARHAVVLLHIDLDKFKQVNDVHGHATGDAVLARFAARLRLAAPHGAIVARLGGEEFVVLMPGALAEGMALADAIRAAVAAPVEALPSVTASIGVATSGAGEPLSATLEHADAATYAAKNAGRDRVMAWSQLSLAA